MPAINTIKGIAPGKIFYHVYGTPISKGQTHTQEPEELVEKIIVTSFPKNWHTGTKSRTDSLFFDVLRNGHRSAHSVRDCGIGVKYNLNRIFATKTEAVEFISECLCGKFFDSKDQEVYNRLISESDDFMNWDW